MKYISFVKDNMDTGVLMCDWLLPSEIKEFNTILKEFINDGQLNGIMSKLYSNNNKFAIWLLQTLGLLQYAHGYSPSLSSDLFFYFSALIPKSHVILILQTYFF